MKAIITTALIAMSMSSQAYESQWTKDIKQMQFQQQWDATLQASAKDTVDQMFAEPYYDGTGLFYLSVLATPLLLSSGGAVASGGAESSAKTIVNIFIDAGIVTVGG